MINDLTGAGRGVVDGTGLAPVFTAASNTRFFGIEVEAGVTAISMGAGVGNVNVRDLHR